MKMLIYIPAFNEAENIQQVIAALPRQLAGIDQVDTLVVDDGSTDRTAELARSAGASVVVHYKNRGVGAAFKSAVQFALEHDADLLVSIDADGQFDPLEIPLLVAPILADRADMVVGNRFEKGKPEDMPGLKFWGNKKVTGIISSISGQKFTDVSCGFRAYDREALLRLNVFGDFTYTHESILSLLYQGLRVDEVPVSVYYDTARKSRVAGSISNYAWQTSKIILRVLLNYRPLRVFGTAGAILIGIGGLFELFLFIYYIVAGSFTPYKAAGFIGLGFILFGMLVLLIALISDMLNRLRINMDQQLYETKKMRHDNRR